MKLSWQDQEEIEHRVASSAFRTLTNSIIDTHSAIKVLAVTITAEFAAFAMFYVSKDKVQDFLADSSSNAWVYGAIAIFLIGFLTAFAGFRLIASNFPRRLAPYMIWPIAIAAGVVNLALFFLLISFQLR